MSPLLIVAIVVVAIALTVRSARRGLGDRYTLDAHHRALDTLAEIAAHRRASGPEGPGTGIGPPPVGSPTAGGRASVPRRVAPPANGSDAWAGAGSGAGPLATGATGAVAGATRTAVPRPPVSPPVVSSGRPSAGRPRVARRRRPAHRGRRVPAAVYALVGLAAVVGLAVAITLALVVTRHHSAAATHRPPAAAPAPVPTTAATAPVVLATTNTLEAHFRVMQATAAVDLIAATPCWVQIRTGSATGPAVFTGTLRPGERRAVPVGQPVWVRVGNPPGLSVQVNGAPLPFSAPVASQPFNLVFEPPA